ncbi:MAG: hypothetical protein RLZZ612_1995 [Pseudomonadota bacterium]
MTYLARHPQAFCTVSFPPVKRASSRRGAISFLGLLAMVLMLLGLAGAYWGWKSYVAYTHQSNTSTSRVPILREEAWSVTYAPGAGKAGVPMQLDVLDVRQTLHLPFLVRTGMVGLKDQATDELGPERLGADGFPALELTWPSVHLPVTDWCMNNQVPTVAACPVFSIHLRSRALTEKDRALLHTKAVLADQEGLGMTSRTVSLWSAFTTVDRDTRPLWAGWVCELDYLVERNEDLHSWGLEEGVFPIDLADTTCHVPTTRLTRFWPELAYHWPTTGGYTLHPVIWQCPLREGSVCAAWFEHRGRLITLEIPGGVVWGDTAITPAYQRVRPQLIQAVWQMLENATHQALEGRDASVQYQRWQQALQQELAWCERLSKHSASDQQGTTPAMAQKIQQVWSRPPWRINSPHPRGPCARGFHRLVHMLEVVGQSQTPATAFPAAAWTQALASAQRLAAVEKQQLRQSSEAMWHLVDELMQHASASAGQPLAVTLARLNWQNTPERLHRDPTAVLAMLNAAGDALTQMPAADLISLRMNLAWALERKVRDRGEDGDAALDQITTLFLQASQAWLNVADDPLAPTDSVALLTHTAHHVRAFGKRLAADGNAREAQAAAVLSVVVRGMETLAQRLARQSHLSPQERVALLGTLAVHGAWHAQYLAFLPAQDTNAVSPTMRGRPSPPPLDAAWVEWLEQWTQWQASQLSHLPQGSKLLAGVELHRDATRSGKRPTLDCPGAQLLGCKMAQP